MPVPVQNLTERRATAGARYAAAAAELRAAMIELAAIDRALNNDNVGYSPRPVPTFGVLPDPINFRHPVYLPDFGGHLPSEVAEASNLIIRGY